MNLDFQQRSPNSFYIRRLGNYIKNCCCICYYRTYTRYCAKLMQDQHIPPADLDR